MYCIYILCFLIFIILLTLIKELNIKFKFNIFITLFLTIVILYFILYPKNCIDASLKGATLFVNSILPSLFPFMIICNLLISFDGINIYSKIIGPILCKPLKLSKCSSFAIVASFLCGYPLGAKYSSDLYEKGLIEKDEFLRLLNIASNAGPLFIIGAIGSSMLGNPLYGYIILASNYISAIIIGILTIKKGSSKTTSIPLLSRSEKNIGEILKESITDAIKGVLTVGGYVIFFSLLISMLKDNALTSFLNNNLKGISYINNLLLGSLDLTNGSFMIATSKLNITIKLCLLSFLCSFGSFSVIAQVNAFIYKHNVPMIKYTLLKFLQGVISIILCYIISYKFLCTQTISDHFYKASAFSSFIPTILIIVISLVILLLDKLLDIS